jgi:hypothetical protein
MSLQARSIQSMLIVIPVCDDVLVNLSFEHFFWEALMILITLMAPFMKLNLECSLIQVLFLYVIICKGN